MTIGQFSSTSTPSRASQLRRGSTISVSTTAHHSYSASSMDRTLRIVLLSLRMHSPITEASQTMTEFGGSQKSRDSGRGGNGSFRYIVLLFLNIGYCALWTLSHSTSISLIVWLRSAVGFRMSRYVFIMFVFYHVHVLQQDVMSLVLRMARIAAANGHLIEIAESRWTASPTLVGSI
jgi:hypothetical protein